MIYFTSDTHYFHRNIIEYCKRPFKDVEHMNAILIKNYNSVVKPKDACYILGDFSFAKDSKDTINIINQLNGTKHFILGNHDKHLKAEVLAHFASVQDYLELKLPPSDEYPRGHLIVMCHYPFKSWNGSHRNSWSLFGHCHGSLPDDQNSLSIDVGVDCHNYTPISYEQIKKIMANKTFKPIDHHK